MGLLPESCIAIKSVGSMCVAATRRLAAARASLETGDADEAESEAESEAEDEADGEARRAAASSARALHTRAAQL